MKMFKGAVAVGGLFVGGLGAIHAPDTLTTWFIAVGGVVVAIVAILYPHETHEQPQFRSHARKVRF